MVKFIKFINSSRNTWLGCLKSKIVQDLLNQLEYLLNTLFDAVRNKYMHRKIT